MWPTPPARPAGPQQHPAPAGGAARDRGPGTRSSFAAAPVPPGAAGRAGEHLASRKAKGNETGKEQEKKKGEKRGKESGIVADRTAANKGPSFRTAPADAGDDLTAALLADDMLGPGRRGRPALPMTARQCRDRARKGEQGYVRFSVILNSFFNPPAIPTA